MSKAIVELIGQLRELDGFEGNDLANFAGVTTDTVSHWNSGRKTPNPRTQLIISDLFYVVMRLNEYYDRKGVRVWLRSRQPQLNGERALELLREERSEEVIAILDRLDADVYL